MTGDFKGAYYARVDADYLMTYAGLSRDQADRELQANPASFYEDGKYVMAFGDYLRVFCGSQYHCQRWAEGDTSGAKTMPPPVQYVDPPRVQGIGVKA